MLSPSYDLSPRQVVVVAPPGSRRVAALQNTLAKLRWPAAQTISYMQVMQHSTALATCWPSGVIWRLDSSGEDLATERLLLALGQQQQGDLSPTEISTLDLEKGRLMPTRQWYRGFSRFLHHLHKRLPTIDHCVAQSTWQQQQVLAMFDKREAQRRFIQAGLPVPPALPECDSYEQLRSNMLASGYHRVFIKLAHGSSASGAVALQIGRQGVRASTTVEMINSHGELRCYNSRRLLHYRDERQIACLIGALLQYHPLQIERWLPKMGMDNRVMDVRVVVTAGKATHVLVRLGAGCITNLHLGGRRGEVEQLVARLGEQRYRQLLELAERGAACFPGALYSGLDLLITTSGRMVLLEANAFGDYHRQVLYRGLDTYATQLLALQEQLQ
ncbi:STM4014 family protein [Serratia microhaemolytica]|uniref:STM4014 family protein n=1 Tax=Serratia microhaemolytica TaxID=2675110 RepID=UPI000FDCFE16|nr:STM4014 family protein [Serratia microhaemolytica]